jgi:class 3 adenylate cyclase
MRSNKQSETDTIHHPKMVARKTKRHPIDRAANLSIGVGIHRGLGLAGLVGSRERKEFSFLGSPVNLAARVQALTRLHQVDILVTDALRAELDKTILLTPMPAEHVKGFAEPVVTYAVKGTIESRPG